MIWRTCATLRSSSARRAYSTRAVGLVLPAEAVAFPNSHFLEGTGAGVRGALKLAPGDGAPLEPECGAVGVLASGVGEVVEERPVGIRRQRVWNARIVVREPGAFMRLGTNCHDAEASLLR